jgi:hypothetical protein
MTKTDITTIIETFQPINKIIGTPNYQSIAARHKILKQNASSVTTRLAGGQHRLLALVINNEEYNELTGEVWIEPQHPGSRPIAGRTTTENDLKSANNRWADDIETWSLVHNIRKALTKQIINAVDDEFIEDLKDHNTGYANVTPLEMVEHLYADYGQLTAQDISENRNQLKKDFDNTKTMVAHFHKIKEIRLIAEKTGNTITDADAIAETYLVIDRCGLFSKAVDDWDETEEKDKTWKAFQQHFKKAYRKYTEKQKRVNANKNMQTPHAFLAKEKPTTTCEDDTKINATLMANNKELSKQISHCMREIAKLQKEVNEIKNKTTRNHGQRKERNEKLPDSTAWKQYCWSCGLTNNRNHNSMNCPTPKPGHKQWATYERKFGGSEENCE